MTIVMDSQRSVSSIGRARSPLDIAQVHHRIADHQEKITLIDGEIEGLLREVRKLRFKRGQHENEIRHHKGLITLARQLPHEILVYIFECCISSGWSQAPLVVSSVCSEWRLAARAGSVWSHLHIFLGNNASSLERIKFWLQRAGTAPLHVTFDVSYLVPQTSEMLALLEESAHRWQSLSIVALLSMQVNYIFSLITYPLPQLRNTLISTKHEFADGDPSIEGDDNHINFRDVFKTSTALQNMHITRDFLSFREAPSSITNLTLDFHPFHAISQLALSSVLDVVNGMPMLEHFSMVIPPGFERSITPEPDHFRRVTLPRLQTMILDGVDDMFVMLSHFLTPGLSNLHLRSMEEAGHPSIEIGHVVCQFFRQSTPPLKLLDLRDVDLTDDAFIEALNYLPDLEELRLHESEISDEVVSQLADTASLCPRLARMDLRWCGNVSGSALVELVHQRRTNSSRVYSEIAPVTIREITVINCSYIKEVDIAQLANETLCRVSMRETNDYCRRLKCCQNDHYRRRLLLQGVLSKRVKRHTFGSDSGLIF